jgi:hypothetical protein
MCRSLYDFEAVYHFSVATVNERGFRHHHFEQPRAETVVRIAKQGVHCETGSEWRNARNLATRRSLKSLAART